MSKSINLQNGSILEIDNYEQCVMHVVYFPKEKFIHSLCSAIDDTTTVTLETVAELNSAMSGNAEIVYIHCTHIQAYIKFLGESFWRVVFKDQ